MVAQLRQRVTVVSRRGMNGLLLKVAEMALVEPEEARGVLALSIRYHIDILWYLDTPT